MRRSLVVAAALGASVVSVVPCLAEGTGVGQASAIDAVIDDAIAGRRIVGAVVLVAYRGHVVYRRAAGYADRERGVAMRDNTIFRFASLSKPLVSAAAMRLVEERKIGLDDPVTRWLPSFQPRLPDGSVPTITIRQLLTHTAGLSYGFAEPDDGPYRKAGVSDGLDDPGVSLDENLRRIASVPLSYAPGQRWAYSMSLDVLGAALASATGKPLPQVVQQQITGPLWMNDTGFHARSASRLATPYQDGAPEPVRMASEAAVPVGGGVLRYTPERALDAHAYPSGGAGMVGTAPDFMRFLLAIRAGGGSVLKPQTVAQMMRDQVGTAAQTQGPGWGFGYGWAVLDDPALVPTPQAKGTIQWGGAYGHTWFFDPVNDIAVVALTNTAVEGMSGEFPRELRDAVYRAFAAGPGAGAGASPASASAR
ncbi:serine hydrolase domain-containing protein [Paraburkholderia caballeronis]|uniref:CubicO group peptidase, beta-lactamase class C family n=1 Tax=Paraburkholderia caballeronis TaxID=416943 RepID=A0A1H7EXM3_9BURK|nr:serine hydrolase domain-containing protein [Paraburkholderia caballeronis]PXW23846.1 CubicO group peptidase (beta-lactamase class C family) [Paraburkholderia caballeronis]PXW99610.1 CubicO group peptidase (beta-lactamase class C family) [Paraburkholderia caballeronis]RAJ96564.1 CubicO group peptidase (beta-lactamase class C family) [Paraburkholderia caballeronis]SEE80437.1 CubicO group peptidase, beta-lactamase class C family [Paraburkholderia caballeronis]SEK18611.1 CubicO group peptidase,